MLFLLQGIKFTCKSSFSRRSVCCRVLMKRS